MNLSAISKKVRQFPILFVCGVITPLALVLLFMRGPKAAQLDTQLASLEREWQNIQTNLERSAGLDADISALESGLEEVEGRLMKAEDVALNSEFFYNLERQTGVIFQRFSQGEATEGQGLNMSVNELRHFSVIPYDISLTGNLEAILGFVDALDRQSFIIRMESLNLNRAQDLQADSSLLNGRIRCHVLARKHE
jgi:hypothetical protein